MGESATLSVTDGCHGRSGDLDNVAHGFADGQFTSERKFKLGHCQIQNRPPRAERGQFPRARPKSKQATTRFITGHEGLKQAGTPFRVLS